MFSLGCIFGLLKIKLTVNFTKFIKLLSKTKTLKGRKSMLGRYSLKDNNPDPRRFLHLAGCGPARRNGFVNLSKADFSHFITHLC